MILDHSEQIREQPGGGKQVEEDRLAVPPQQHMLLCLCLPLWSMATPICSDIILDQSWCRQKVRFSYQDHLLLQLIQVPVLLPLPSILTTILPGEREREKLAWSRRKEGRCSWIPWKSSAAVSLLVQDGDVENVDSSGKVRKKLQQNK